MLVSPIPERQLFALAALQAQPRWKDLDDLLTAEISAWTQRMLDNGDYAVLHECRGRIKALKDFQSSVRDAPKMLEKMGLRAPF